MKLTKAQSEKVEAFAKIKGHSIEEALQAVVDFGVEYAFKKYRPATPDGNELYFETINLAKNAAVFGLKFLQGFYSGQANARQRDVLKYDWKALKALAAHADSYAKTFVTDSNPLYDPRYDEDEKVRKQFFNYVLNGKFKIEGVPPVRQRNGGRPKGAKNKVVVDCPNPGKPPVHTQITGRALRK